MKAARLVVVVALTLAGASFWFTEGKYDGTRIARFIFAADGQTLYGSGIHFSPKEHHGWLWAWATQTGRLRWTARVEGPVHTFHLSPDGKSLLTAGALWNADTGRVRCQLKSSEEDDHTERVFFSPDGARALGCYRNGVQVWDVPTGERVAFWKVAQDKTGWPESLHFSTDGKRLLVGATGWYSGKEGDPVGIEFVQLWDGNDGRVLQDFAASSPVCALSPDGSRVALAKSRIIPDNEENGSIGNRLVIRSADGGPLRIQSPELPPHFDLEALTFLPDGNLRCDGTRSRVGESMRPQRFLWDVTTGRIVEQPVEEGTRSPDGQLIARANEGGRRKRPPLGGLYDAKTGAKRCDLEGQAGW